MTSINRFMLGMVLTLLVGCIAIVGYVTPFIVVHQTRITKDEIVIGRVDGFGQTTRYVKNLVSGDEEMVVMKFTFLSNRYLSIKSSGACHCLTSVYYDDRDTGQYYSLTRSLWNGLMTGIIGREISSTTGYVNANDPVIEEKMLHAGKVLEATRHRFVELTAPSHASE